VVGRFVGTTDFAAPAFLFELLVCMVSFIDEIEVNGRYMGGVPMHAIETPRVKRVEHALAPMATACQQRPHP
jgi:hypothetical protein